MRVYHQAFSVLLQFKVCAFQLLWIWYNIYSVYIIHMKSVLYKMLLFIVQIYARSMWNGRIYIYMRDSNTVVRHTGIFRVVDIHVNKNLIKLVKHERVTMKIAQIYIYPPIADVVWHVFVCLLQFITEKEKQDEKMVVIDILSYRCGLLIRRFHINLRLIEIVNIDSGKLEFLVIS